MSEKLKVKHQHFEKGWMAVGDEARHCMCGAGGMPG